MPQNYESKLNCEALAVGLQCIGIVDLDLRDDFARFCNWLNTGMNAEMEYLRNHLDLRANPQLLLPGAKCAVVLGMNYGVIATDKKNKQDNVAAYAHFRDYHKTIKKKCTKLIDVLKGKELLHASTEVRICVDSAPILERALARKSSQGFVGKNTMFIMPKIGSYLLLGVILLTEDLPKSEIKIGFDPSHRHPSLGGCGSCRRCQVHCPTGALNDPYQVDARKCLSYWTIEHRGLIPQEFWPHLGKTIFGCDICQNVCPYNRSPQHPNIAADKPWLDKYKFPSLFSIATMSESDYLQWFSGTPLIRAKWPGLRRNALIALYVTHDERIVEALESCLKSGLEVVQKTAEQIKDLIRTLK